jgi:hypothetical protein
MRNAVHFSLLLFSFVFTGCTTALLHSELAVEIVPEVVEGAQPYYVDTPPPLPSFEPLVDTLTGVRRTVGQYLMSIIPYKGVAIWRADTMRRDTVAEAFLNVDGLLDFEFKRRESRLRISQYSAHFEIDFKEDSLVISRLREIPSNFDPYQFLNGTLGISGHTNGQDYYLNCPDPDSILAGFTLELLNAPTCKYD